MEKKPIIPSCKRTTWTTAMDRCFIQIMVDQVHDGQYLDGQFSKHAWRMIVDEFKNKFGPEFPCEIMKNHYRAIKKSHSAIKTLLDESGFGWDADREMVYADSDSVWDDYIKAHPDFKIWRTKSMAGYDQLCIIFGDGGATGKFSRAPEDKVLYTEKAGFGEPLYFIGEQDYETQEPINLDEEPEEVNLKKHSKSPIPLPNSEKYKKPRRTTGEGMVDAIQGMASAFTEMANKKVNSVLVPPTTSLTLEGKVVAVLGAIPDIADATYMLALDLLEEEKKARMFVELPLEKRRDWLLHKLKEN